jgi:hypothetical protein
VIESANDRSDNKYRNDHFHLFFAPSLSRKEDPQIEQQELLPEGTLLRTRKSLEGFSMELAIPIEYIRSQGGSNWETLRVNVSYYDRDNKDSRTQIWWKPNWSSPQNYIGSGMFFRLK